MKSSRKRSSGTQLGHDKRNISAVDMSNFIQIWAAYNKNTQTDIRLIVLSCGPNIKSAFKKYPHWWLLIAPEVALVPALDGMTLGPSFHKPTSFSMRDPGNEAQYKSPDFTTKRAFARE